MKNIFDEDFDIEKSLNRKNEKMNKTKVYTYTLIESFTPSYVGITGREELVRGNEHQRDGRFSLEEGTVTVIAQLPTREAALAMERQMIINGKKIGCFKLNKR